MGFLPSIFHVFAGAYDLLTDQGYWDDAIGRLLEAAGPLPPAPRVLDLGCGPGVSTFALARRLAPGATLIGVDAAPRMIDRARRHHERRHPGRGNLAFAVADAAHLDFPDGAFDLVTGHSFLYLVADRAAVLREARRVLAPAGVLALMEPDADGNLARAARAAASDWTHLVRHPLDAGRFAASMVSWRAYSRSRDPLTPAGIGDLLRAAGFGAWTCRPTLGGLGMHVVARPGP